MFRQKAPIKRGKPAKIAVCDLEWLPHNLKIRMLGFYDGKRYLAFETIESFFRYTISEKYNGYTVYAHFGGGSDFLFFLQAIVTKYKFHCEVILTGSLVLMLTIKGQDFEIRFVDSYRLLPHKLQAIAKTIGMQKGEVLWDAPMAELRDYNEQDCWILFRAIRYFEAIINDLGSDMGVTLPATALRLFQRKYLQKDILTIPWQNEKLRPAYIGARVEVFRMFSEHETVHLYDINSSFSTSMLEPLPGKFLRSSRTYVENPKHGEIAFIDATITVDDCDIPPLPFRTEKSIFFPHGTWRCWFTQDDLQLLEESAFGTVQEVHEAWYYEKRDDAKFFAEDLFEKRKAAIKAKDKFLTQVYKDLPNSFYGKMAEGNDKEWFILFPDEPPIGGEAIKGKPGFWRMTESKPPPHQHLPIPITIASKGRRRITNLLWQSENPAYTDTDNVASLTQFQTGEELGQLKLVSSSDRWLFLLPKFYQHGELFKAKGFGRLGEADLGEIVRGGLFERDELSRYRSMLKRSEHTLNFRVASETQRRGIANPVLKRKFHSQGRGSDPYSVGEILGGQFQHLKQLMDELEV